MGSSRDIVLLGMSDLGRRHELGLVSRLPFLRSRDDRYFALLRCRRRWAL